MMKKIIPTVEQQAVLDCDEDMVITACPGSGKTAIISEKVRQVLPLMPAYRGVVAISYTRKASAELKKRCGFDGLDTKQSFFGTIDAFSISEIIAPFFGHICGKTPINLSVKYFNSLSDHEKEVFDDISLNEISLESLEVMKDRLQELYLNGILLMETVGILAVYVLMNSEACRRYLKSRYAVIFIDEYQDSGEPQHVLFTKFKDLGIRSVAVGDINQSIFGFSHRDPKYLKSLCRNGSGYRHLELTINHRCHPSIVNYADRLLNGSCELNPTDDIRVYRRSVTGTQVEVVDWINKNLEKAKEKFEVKHNREIGILVRNSNTGSIVSNHLQFQSRLFTDNDLSSSTTPCSVLFMALLCFRLDARLTAQSIINEFLRKRLKREKSLELRKLIINCRKCDDKHFVTAAGLVASCILEETPASSFEELESVLGNPSDLKSFHPVSDDEVQIMTLHKAKGLEFKVVFHLDLYDWILPRRTFIQGNYDTVFENEQECLNLHYVGITRAQNACVLLSSSQRYNFNNEIKAAKPSQFYERPGLDGLFK